MITQINPQKPLQRSVAPTSAASLALSRQSSSGRSLSLLPQLHEAAKSLTALHQALLVDKEKNRELTPQAKWLYENHWYLLNQIRALRLELTQLQRTRFPHLTNGPCFGFPRIYEIAIELAASSEYRITEENVTRFIQEYQQHVPLTLRELWSIESMIRLALLEELGRTAALMVASRQADVSFQPEGVEHCIRSINGLSKIEWLELGEKTSRVEHVLRQDPAGIYTSMDFDTRDEYRHAVEDVACHSPADEEQVARAALQFARDAARRENPSPRMTHVGYYLVDRGADHLKSALHYQPSFRGHLSQAALRSSTAFYLVGVELLTLLLAAYLLSFLPAHMHQVALILFLLATEPAVTFMNQLTTKLLPPRKLPKLDFSDGIPEHCATMVVVPTLLLSEKFINSLIDGLEVRFLANRDPQLTFALLTDFKDAPEPQESDAYLADVCAAGIKRLNARYGSEGRKPFYLFHRRREWNAKQGAWMGWERKRGKLIALNNLLRGEGDAFDLKVGDLSKLSRIRYVLTLDSDTELPRDVAHRMIGTMEHPLNRPVIDEHTNTVREGYGILQPRVGISVQSAKRSRLAAIYSGQTGFDLYSTAASDVYQDLFGEGSYVGKGIYDVDVFQATLSKRFPHDILLSHDLIEGAYARAGLASDIEVIDDYPSHYSAWSKRKHRWVRGDWQIMQWLLPRVPDYRGQRVANPLSIISLWKIVDNLRRSLMEIALFILLVAGWSVLPGGPRYWTITVLAVTLLPVYIHLLFVFARLPGPKRWPTFPWQTWARDTLSAFVSGHVEVALRLIFLAHQTGLMLDAILRTLIRTMFTGRRLLEWESAAQAELGGSARALRSTELYLWLSTPLAVACAIGLLLANRAAIPYAAPLLLAWMFSPLFAMWLNSSAPPLRERLREEEREFLSDVAQRTWRFFDQYSSAEENWLIPDNVLEEPPFVAHRISPTNMGFLLNAQLAALDFGLISKEQLSLRLERIFDSLEKLERHRGHFFNWYDTQTLQALPPRYVSTVDSGNLAACLLAAEYGCMELEMPNLARRAAKLFENMDFAFLLHKKRKLFHIGYNVESGQLDDSFYDLLASEARLASFVAIAKNDVPQKNWVNLGRTLSKERGHRVLLSWSGTMFEYLMPQLWLRSWENTLLDQTVRGAIRIQQAFAKEKKVPWGVSESACSERVGEEFRYHAFGVPELALRGDLPDRTVIAPYATALALTAKPREALRNLKRLADRKWLGEYGFYESADFTDSPRETVVRGYMAHHQGMILLALDHALNDGPMQRRFHASPLVQSAEMLLQEKLRFTTTSRRDAHARREMRVVTGA